MIEKDIVAHLKSDATLDALLNSSPSDSKIYPEIATQYDQRVTPFIVYAVTIIGSAFEKILDEDMINFKIVDPNFDHAGQILDRLKFLLEINDEFRLGVGIPSTIASTTFYIYSGIRTGGTDWHDQDTKRFMRTVMYNFTYKKKIA